MDANILDDISHADPAQRKDREERWAQVVAVSAALFAQKGYEATSLREIAERVGMLKGSLYHYINGKSDLLVHVLREAHSRGVLVLTKIAEREGQALERLEEVITAHAKYICTERVFTAGFIEAHRHLTPDRAREFDVAERNYRKAVERLIARGQVEGDLRDDLDPKVSALCLLGFLNSLHGWVKPASGLTTRRLCDHALAMGLGGLRKT
ncbi:TetR/AcrR family transcriptional regulator [Croceicoccus gelatinilyticus]|uniref:TetR/AcrR family transcriptional regulator n=1 Tax=Croceicoccus gelatinilyticus TaxID=2835536 RepID=UPI001BCD9F86|nr:TetR/AcrR family transcriptional regulator [Croceicoccus gelatinilyticus]MBS7670069.1 TetR family transcriptional regulator [Croceicoccus gelatinilyticus]